MNNELTVFNYEALEVETREFVKGKELSIKARTSQTIWENGRDLLEVKERLEHGQFQKWVEGNFPWSIRTAQKMIQVAENVKAPDLTLLRFTTDTLFLLAQNSTPESARTEAIEKAESGEVISHKEAKELIEAHKAYMGSTPFGHCEVSHSAVGAFKGFLCLFIAHRKSLSTLWGASASWLWFSPIWA